MELTSKQRAKLRSLAQNIEVTASFGKDELTDEQIIMIDQLLTKRELIKATVLETSPYEASELLAILAEKCDAVPVTAIGRKIVLYRRNQKEPKIIL